jgi:beta-aspartyl-peptidase (threonine type)
MDISLIHISSTVHSLAAFSLSSSLITPSESGQQFKSPWTLISFSFTVHNHFQNCTFMSSVASAPVSGRWSLAIHGGAGAISREFDPERKEYLLALQRCLDAGSQILKSGGNAVDATVAAVTQLENEPLFNAGVGSVLTVNGQHELDAGIMRGSDSHAGAVAGLQHVEHPIQLAKLVMEKSPHVLLAGQGAEAFARSQGVPMVENALFTTPARLQIHHELLENARKMQLEQSKAEAGIPYTGSVTSSSIGWAPTSSPQPALSMAGLTPILDHAHETVPGTSQTTPASEAARATGTLAEKKYGTVGAVAMDQSGEIACAISTGGMSLKAWGRIGDTPIIGCGFYATSNVAVACTGNGEAFLRSAVAKDVSCLMEYKGLSLHEATQQAMRNGEKLCGTKEFEGGLIAVDKEGRISMPFNSKGMYRGSVTNHSPPTVAVWKE